MIKPYKDFYPVLAVNTFVAENATVIGDVECRAGSSIWFGAVVRGDDGSIRIGENTNIQDNAIIHSGEDRPVCIGDQVTIGHNAIVHGCTVGSRTLVGMHATLLNGCRIGNNCIIGAGALVPENKVIPDNSIVMGVPAKIVGTVEEERLEHILENADKYCELAQTYLA